MNITDIVEWLDRLHEHQQTLAYEAHTEADSFWSGGSDVWTLEGAGPTEWETWENLEPHQVDVILRDREAKQAEIERLRDALNYLEVEVMHPDMGGHHQCTIRANCKKLPPHIWATILEARKDPSDD